MKKETKIFDGVFHRWNPSAPLPKLEIRYYPYSTLSHTIRLRQGAIKIRISHLFRDAPNDVLEAVGHILFSKLYQHRPPAEALDRYHRYVETQQIRFRRLLRGRVQLRRTTHRTVGAHQDLGEIFERVNRRYFKGGIARPTLAWSRPGMRSKLGEYQSLRHTIVINHHLDNAGTPAYVLEYLMFHEMLHVKHGAEIRNGRRRVHTRAFRDDEKQFKEFSAAQEWIRRVTLNRTWREGVPSLTF